MQTEPIAERDVKALRADLTESQQALFDDWQLFAEKWIKRHYLLEDGPYKIRDFQSALSEALLALRYAAATYEWRGSFKSYLQRVLRGRMIDLVRKQERLRQISIEMRNEEDDSAKHGIDGDNLDALQRESIPCQQEGHCRERSRKPRKRFRGGWSAVLWEVIHSEAMEIARRTWRERMRYCGYSEDEIDRAERREKRKIQQRRRRQRQRQAIA